jgi:hypothetical protein
VGLRPSVVMGSPLARPAFQVAVLEVSSASLANSSKHKRRRAMPARRFPPPWSVELQPNYYVVRDANARVTDL